MKRCPLFASFAAITCAVVCLLPNALAAADAPDTLRQDFTAPPVKARPMVWWHWMSNNVSEAGIDRDLAAMKEMGIGGALLTTLASLPSQPGNPKIENTPWPDNVYFSPAWWKLVRHACELGRQNEIEIGFPNCPGWAVSGGVWITPELSMQKLVWSETKTPGGAKFTRKLPRPKLNPKYDYYRDVAVLAVPAGNDVAVDAVVDLTGRMQTDGTLEWDAPAGDWSVYRFGHTTTGVTSHPEPDGFPPALECDKLSEKASAFHADHIITTLREHVGEFVGNVMSRIHFDSYEAGPLNWTDDYREQFRRLRGYDPVPWLPVIAGRTLGGADRSKRFEWDMARTVSDLYVKASLATFKRVIEKANLRMSSEPYTGPFDTVAATAECTSPMTEFWSNPDNWRTGREDHDVITRTVAASAQAADKRIVGAEAVTGFPMDSKWTEDPAFLKPRVDEALCNGVNQFELHSWVAQPFDEKYKPGLTLSWWGTHFGPNQTWFHQGKAFFTYMARCAALLQHGAVVSDFCTLEFALPHGDALSDELLLGARAQDNCLVLTTGRRYPVLVLPPDERAMRPVIAAKIKELVAAGLTVVGPKPLTSPSLEGFPESDRLVAAIGAEVWGNADGGAVKENRHGTGRVFWNVPVAEVLAKIGVQPDFSLENATGADVKMIHRREGDCDVYMVANLGRQPVDAMASFRVTGKVPEWWNAVDGTTEDAGIWETRKGITYLPMRLGPTDARFVVFRRASAEVDPVQSVLLEDDPDPFATIHPDASGVTRLRTPDAGPYNVIFASGRRVAMDVPELPAPMGLDGAWSVKFDPAVGGPSAPVEMKALTSWTEAPESEVKYYSGTATYKKSFTLSAGASKPGQRIALDLGAVHNLAQVRVNGRDLGVLWFAPFAVDVTGVVREGTNELEILVTNTWHNRLIGDEQQPPDIEWGPPRMFRKDIPVGTNLVRFPEWLLQDKPRPSTQRQTFVSWNYFTKDAPLTDSGLIGPVKLTFSADLPLPR